MDSLTQIILGAACGEAVAGRKIGNRAMLWGAVGGTIPDLDVLSSFLTDEMTALAFHRGIMHSILFACLMPWVIAAVIHRLYSTGIYRRWTYKKWAWVIAMLAYAGCAFAVNQIPIMMSGHVNWLMLGISLALGTALGLLLWMRWVKREQTDVQFSYFGWVQLFFWSIFTHPILDAFTGYGTQLFQPFSDYRVQWDTVSIVDPIYTVPFAFSLLIAARIHKASHWRRLANWAGIALSCAYLAYTINHKMEVNDVFRRSLASHQIDYQRFTTGPTIFNNILWKGIVEADSCYYFATWGFNDRSNLIEQFTRLPKSHDLAPDSLVDARDLQTLRWFSDGYYNVIQDSLTGERYINDLRFGITGEKYEGLDSYIFSWRLVPDKTHAGKLVAKQYDEPRGDASKMFSALMTRIKGK
jgi:inner membrane protein